MYVSLDSYRVFFYVAQYHSFTKAAQVLYSNQPNVTRTIKNLEQALGCSLFLRSSRSVQLTPEGEALLSHIRPAMEQIRAGEEDVLLHSTMQSGTVSIGVSEIALHRVLLPALEQFRKSYPGIRLRILNSNSPQALSALKENLVDLSLLTLPLEYTERYACRELASFQEVAVCGAQFVSSVTQPLTVSSLSQLPLISLCRDSSTHRLYRDWFQSHGLTFSPDIEAATSDQILPMVQANLGIGFIPEETAQRESRSGSVTILPLSELPPPRTISLVKRRDISLSIAAGKLEDILLHFSSL